MKDIEIQEKEDAVVKKEQQSFVKKHKKVIGIISTMIALILIYILTCVIHSAVQNHRVRTYLDGKAFINRNGIWTSAYIFEGKTVRSESWCSSDQSVWGDIQANGNLYRVESSLWDKQLIFWEKKDGNWSCGITATLQKDGVVVFDGGEWSETTIEEIEKTRNELTCSHEYGQETVIREATCTKSGEMLQICSKCGFSTTTYVGMKEHSYVNKVCTICGGKEKVPTSKIEPNTWYVYDDVLKYQNCELQSAIVVNGGRSMSVMYYAVCQYCHAIDSSLEMAGPGVNYPVDEIHTCDECERQTVVKFEIQ